jgi:hypothetical protein
MKERRGWRTRVLNILKLSTFLPTNAPVTQESLEIQSRNHHKRYTIADELMNSFIRLESNRHIIISQFLEAEF